VVSAASDCATLKSGDNVVYSKYAGTEVTLGGEDHIILKEADCIGLMSGDDIGALKPLGDRVLVKLAEQAAKSKGGVILTALESDKPSVGVVTAVGPGRKEGEGEAASVKAVAMKVGDNVLFSQYAGVEFESPEGEQYIVVQEGDILAVLG